MANYARKKITIDPRLPLPPLIEDVVIDQGKDIDPMTFVPPPPLQPPPPPAPLPGGGDQGPNKPPVLDRGGRDFKPPINSPKIVEQRISLNAAGQAAVDVVFELGDNPEGWVYRISKE